MGVRGVGAPLGLTVHWLADELRGEFSINYRLSYNKKYHNYHYARYRKRMLIDEFIVVRTSKRCYRVIYFNNDYKHFQYFSAENYRDCAVQMIAIFKVFQQLEQSQKTKEKTAETPLKGKIGD